MSRICTHGERGTAMLIVVMILVLASVAMVMLVRGGAREQQVAVQRLATVRAFYAAEAGMNLAILEVMDNQDSDGDGSIGTISDDGNQANDPDLGSATCSVTSSSAGSSTTLTSTGISDAARRELQADLQY